METRELQQVTAAQALVNELNARFCGTSPRYPDSLRSKLDRELLDGYAEDGTDRKRIELGGDNVATYSVVAGKPAEVKQFVVDDERAFLRWLTSTEEGADALRHLLYGSGHTALMAAVWCAFEETGVVPDGCLLDVHTEPGRPRTMLKVDQEQFARAIGGSLQSAVALLEEGEEE